MNPRHEADEQRELSRQAALCARSEQCSADVAGRLRRRGLSAEAIARVIGYLTEHRYIDDRRYAAAFVADKVRFACWGRRRIRMALTQKRLPESIISEAMETVDTREYAAALLRAARSRARGLDLGQYADSQRLARALASRGYEPEIVFRAIAHIRRHPATGD